VKISVIIATHGDEKWERLAKERAYPSACAQVYPFDDGNDATPEVCMGHYPHCTLAEARNISAQDSTGDWLCFLDADDELAPGFLAAMSKAAENGAWAGGKTLFTPRVSYTSARGKREAPKFWPECSLTTGNWLVVSTLIPRDLFLSVGGFRDYGDPPGSIGYEDWGLFALLVQAGAEIVKVPRAVLIAHITPQSRNRSPGRKERLRWHYEVGRDVWPDVYDDEWKRTNRL